MKFLGVSLFILPVCLNTSLLFAQVHEPSDSLDEKRLFMTADERQQLLKQLDTPEEVKILPEEVSTIEEPTALPADKTVTVEYGGVVVRSTQSFNPTAVVWVNRKMQTPANWNAMHVGRQRIRIFRHRRMLQLQPGESVRLRLGEGL